MFSSWTDVVVVLTKDNFLHVYNSVICKDVTSQYKDRDFSNPLFTVNLNCLDQLDTSPNLKKDLKFQLVQSKCSNEFLKSRLTVKEAKKHITHIHTQVFESKESLNLKSDTIEEKCISNQKYPEKVIFKAKSQEDYNSWVRAIDQIRY